MAVISNAWLNQNANRNFPFHEDATLVATDGWKIPFAMLTDLSFSVVVDQFDPTQFFVGYVEVAGEQLIITISYNGGGGQEDVAKVFVDVLTHTENQSYFVVAEPGYEQVTGRATLGPTTFLSELVPGNHEFNFNSARLVTSAVRPSITGVTSITTAGETITGDITLNALAGVNVSVDTVTKEITLSVDPDTIDLSQCGCDDGRVPLFTINGVSPNDAGNINIRGFNCMNVSPGGPAELRIIDNCSAPCCDCEGLQTISDALAQLQGENTQLVSYIDSVRARLDAAVDAYQNCGNS